jgi:tetratricopeptide (TPR) repeat protein
VTVPVNAARFRLGRSGSRVKHLQRKPLEASNQLEVKEESMLYDRAYLAPSHLRRAEIYEKLGDREKAIFHYSRFLELWKDCDDALRPQVPEAEKRLERLKGSA